MKLDAQVDMIEFREYREVDLDETPVIALACRHFFTTETLDGTYVCVPNPTYPSTLDCSKDCKNSSL